MTFRLAENYPVDLYFLMDVSRTMRSYKENLVALSDRLGLSPEPAQITPEPLPLDRRGELTGVKGSHHWVKEPHMVVKGLICSLVYQYIHRVRKKGGTLFLPVTLRNANRFSKFFYCHALQ